MDSSLSVVLAVHNAQASLAKQVSLLLEVLPELSSRFEVLIVDDASTDETEEVAAELVSRYPQVRMVRHGQRRGISAAVKTGLDRTTGEIVFVQDERSPLSQRDLCDLWKWRNDTELVMAQAQRQSETLAPSAIDRLLAWGEKLRKRTSIDDGGGIQMIRRSAAAQITVDELNQADAPQVGIYTESASRTDMPPSGAAKPKRPNILSKIKDFAVGQ